MKVRNEARALLAAFAVMGSTAGSAADDDNLWLKSFGQRFVIVDAQSGDLDGDGLQESVLCLRDEQAPLERSHSIAILEGPGVRARLVYFGVLEGTRCEKLRTSAKKLGVLLPGRRQLMWTYGEDFRFDGLRAGMQVKASSMLNAKSAAAAAVDGDVSTSWAEGARGTGIGQGLQLRFDKPIDIAALAIIAGNAASDAAFFDDNRLHRATVNLRTEADLGDVAAGIDFQALGIDAAGDSFTFAADNTLGVTYVHVDARAVLAVSLRIDSVYLGEHDDTRVAELFIIEMVPLSRTVDRSVALKPKAGKDSKDSSDGKESTKPPPAAGVDAGAATRSGTSVDGDASSPNQG